MNVLILGGTIFLGRHLVSALQERGHTVTLFNRGVHIADDLQQIEKLHGNRDGDLSALVGRKWDAVIDTCGYVPRIVGMSAQLLAPNVDRYIFISSVSVYQDNEGIMDETSSVIKLSDIKTEEITSETYGGLKYLCEQAAEDAMPGRVLIIRPGLIVGANDWSGRFSYWVNRASTGGKVLVPDASDQECQFIDVRDLAEWITDMVEKKTTGIYNADGDANVTFGNVLKACFSGKRAGEYEFVKVSEEFLLEHEVEPYRELPLWVPKAWGNRIFSSEKAINEGLLYCRLSDTVEDIRSWLLTVKKKEKVLGKSLTAEREQELIEKWKISENS